MPNPKNSITPQHLPERTLRLPKSKKKSKSGFVAVRQTFSGPLPLPSHFAQYNQIVPGAAERILKMAENQSQHRQECEKIEIKTNSRNSTLGLILGFIVCCGLLAGAIYLISIGKTIAGLIALVIQMGSLVTAFIFGKDGPPSKRSK